jgi:hypothetical protein
MQLREAGVSFEKIAESLGYRDRSSAYKAVMAGLRAARLEPAKALRQLELRRLDKLWLALWAQATAKPPDYASFDRLIKIMQRRAALTGLDINKLALTNPTGEKQLSSGDTNILRIDWDAPGRSGADEIEEKIKQVGATVVDTLPNQSVSPGGQNCPPENLQPSKNGQCHD